MVAYFSLCISLCLFLFFSLFLSNKEDNIMLGSLAHLIPSIEFRGSKWLMRVLYWWCAQSSQIIDLCTVGLLGCLLYTSLLLSQCSVTAEKQYYLKTLSLYFSSHLLITFLCDYESLYHIFTKTFSTIYWVYLILSLLYLIVLHVILHRYENKFLVDY
jgi:hypothetical protein